MPDTPLYMQSHFREQVKDAFEAAIQQEVSKFRDAGMIDSEWKAVMHEARKLVRDAPRLSADEAHNRLLGVLEKLRAWMEKYDVPTPYNATLLNIVETMAVEQIEPGKHRLAELVGMVEQRRLMIYHS